MKVLVTGATGFTGTYVVRQLVAREVDVTVFVRASSDTANLPNERIRFAIGNLDDPPSLQYALRDMDALVNVASLGFGHGQGIVRATESVGVPRAIFVSTTAIFTSLNAPSRAVRLAAEEVIQKSCLSYSILRPTMIYGSSRDRNICRLIRFLNQWPVIPIFGAGESLQQPVFVEDLAAAIVETLFEPRTTGQCYNVSGADALTYNAMIDTVCELLNRTARKWHIPVRPVVAALKSIERLHLKLPVKAEQVLRMNEDKAFDHSAAVRDFGYRPRRFAQGITSEIVEMGLMPSIQGLVHKR